MSHIASARTTTRRTLRPTAAGVLVVIAVLIATLVRQSTTSSTTNGGAQGRTVTEADGVLPEGVTVFDHTHPGVANLDPDLLRALRAAATAAARDGVVLHVNSGWRSAAYQDQLLRDAVRTYGSAEEAARWVATAETSAHVSGSAVDIGSSDATAWLHRHGAAYGLCQIYDNESWHYERRPAAIARGCPAMYADPTQDPRMRGQ